MQFHRQECRDCGSASPWSRRPAEGLEWLVGHTEKRGHRQFYEYTVTRRQTSVRRNGVF